MLKEFDKEFLFELSSTQYLEKPVTSLALCYAGENTLRMTDLLYNNDFCLREEAQQGRSKRNLDGHI